MLTELLIEDLRIRISINVLTLPVENLINATKEFGIFIPDDQASGDAYGGYFCPHNMDPVNVTRSSAKEAYYDTASARPNFHIITGNQVTRLLSEKKNGTVKVTGVEVGLSSYFACFNDTKPHV